jgi:hypothetical protein
LLAFELRLDGAQGVNLAGDADHGQPFVALCQGGLHQAQQRCVTHAHAPALRHVLGAGDQHRARAPPVMRVGGHGDHGVDQALFEQHLGQAGGDASPLRALRGWVEACAQDLLVRPKEQLVGLGWVRGTALLAHAAMDPLLQARVIGLDELAGLAAALGVIRAREAAVGAQLACRGCVGAGLGWE